MKEFAGLDNLQEQIMYLLPGTERGFESIFQKGETQMTDSQKLDYLIEQFGEMRADIKELQKGMDRVEKRLDSLEQRMDAVEKRLDTVEKRMDSLERRMDAVEKRLDAVEKRMDSLEMRMDAVEKLMDAVEKRLDVVEQRLDAVEQRLDKQEEEIRYIRLFQENHLQAQIRRIAEGHLDLYRKLLDALRISGEDELIHVRVNMLESDMKRVKDRLAMG